MSEATIDGAKKTPIFTILSSLFVVVCFTTPIIFLTLPIMLTIAMAVVAMVRKERPRWIAPVVAVLAVLLVFAASAQVSDIRGDSVSNLAAADLEDWSWNVDPDFGTTGTIKWRVVVRNISDRAIRNVRVNFSTYDSSDRLLTSDFSYVRAIPPGETRSVESFADYYGTENTARAVVSEVHFSN